MTAEGAMTIGPVGLDIPMTVPESGRWSGDTLTLSGTIGDQCTSPTVARALRDQFHGLADRIGDILPVTFGDTPELDGWYEIARPTISSDGPSFENGVFNVSADLTRVRSSAQVLQEMRLLGAGRNNAHSFTTVRRGWYSPGCAAYGVDDATTLISPPTRYTRTGSDGPMLVVVDNASGTLFTANTAIAPHWYVSPTDFYEGGCNIVRAVGGTYYRVVGEEIPAGFAGSWAIGNTLVSILGSTTAGKAEWSMLWHDGAGFESFKTFRLTTDTSWTEFGYGPVGMQVIRNNVDTAAVRIFYGTLNSAYLWTLDISLRRGARHAEFKVTAPYTDANTYYGVKLTSAEAGTTHTSGVHATAADASGNKYILTSPVAIVADTTNGRLRQNVAASTFSFMVGAEMAGAGGGFDDFTSIVYQYMGALHTRQAPVIG